MTLKTQCPNCQKILTLKTTAALGKRVPCPKCKEPFTVKKHKEEEIEDYEEDEIDDYEDDAYDEYDDYEDDYDDYEDDYDDYEEPRRKSRPAAPKSRSRGKTKGGSRKKKGGGVPPWVFGAIGGVVALGLLITAAVFLMSGGGFGGNVVDMSYLPKNTEAILYAEPSEIVNSAMLAPLMEEQQIKNGLAELESNFPAALSDISSVTIGVLKDPNASDAYLGGPLAASSGQTRWLGVMRFKKDVTNDDIARMKGFREAQFDGKDYYVNMPSQVAFWRAESKLAVFGSKDEVEQSMDRGAQEPRLDRFDWADANHHLFFVISPENTMPRTSGTDALSKTLNKNAKAVYLGLNVTSDIEFDAGLDCYGSEQAEAVKLEFDRLVKSGKAKLDQGGGSNALPQQEAILDIAKKVHESIRVRQSGSSVSFSAQVPGETVEVVRDLASNPFMLMGIAAAMQSQLGGQQPGGFGQQPGGLQQQPGGFGQRPGGVTNQPGGGVQPGGQPGSLGASPQFGAGNASAVKLELTVEFSGSAPPGQAAQDALKTVEGISGLSFDQATSTLKMQIPRDRISPAKTALTNAGFTITKQHIPLF